LLIASLLVPRLCSQRLEQEGYALTEDLQRKVLVHS
jgi:hypothetical protein